MRINLFGGDASRKNSRKQKPIAASTPIEDAKFLQEWIRKEDHKVVMWDERDGLLIAWFRDPDVRRSTDFRTVKFKKREIEVALPKKRAQKKTAAK